MKTVSTRNPLSRWISVREGERGKGKERCLREQLLRDVVQRNRIVVEMRVETHRFLVYPTALIGTREKKRLLY